MLIVGIDPGFLGAISVLTDQGALLSVVDMPVILVKKGKSKKHRYDEPAIRKILADVPAPVHVILEYQQAFPKQGGVSNFTTGGNYGFLRGVLAGLAIPYETVTPRAWKKAMLAGLGPDKCHSLAKAKALWPTADFGNRADAGRAEASLIGEYGRRVRAGLAATSDHALASGTVLPAPPV